MDIKEVKCIVGLFWGCCFTSFGEANCREMLSEWAPIGPEYVKEYIEYERCNLRLGEYRAAPFGYCEGLFALPRVPRNIQDIPRPVLASLCNQLETYDQAKEAFHRQVESGESFVAHIGLSYFPPLAEIHESMSTGGFSRDEWLARARAADTIRKLTPESAEAAEISYNLGYPSSSERLMASQSPYMIGPSFAAGYPAGQNTTLTETQEKIVKKIGVALTRSVVGPAIGGAIGGFITGGPVGAGVGVFLTHEAIATDFPTVN